MSLNFEILNFLGEGMLNFEILNSFVLLNLTHSQSFVFSLNTEVCNVDFKLIDSYRYHVLTSFFSSIGKKRWIFLFSKSKCLNKLSKIIFEKLLIVVLLQSFLSLNAFSLSSVLFPFDVTAK